MDGLHEIFSIEGVQDFVTRKPATSRRGNTVVQTSQPAGRMGVGRYDEFNTTSSRGADPVRLEVETVGVAVDFDGASGLGDGVEHLVHSAFERRARPNQSAQRMTPDLEERQLQRAQQPLGHLFGIHPVARMNTRDDDIELLQKMIGIVQRTIFKNIRFGAFQKPYLDALLYPRDLVPLGPQAINTHAARIMGAG